MQDFLSKSHCLQDMLSLLQKEIIYEITLKYNYISKEESNLVTVLEKVYEAEKDGFVFIIDEWDCIFREKKQESDMQTGYLDFLRALLKDKSYVKLAYMTGILPIKK